MVKRTTHIITKAEVRDNKDTLYLFGDNTQRMGMGGQAKEMRGEPNTCGVCTKLYPNNSDGSFMSDNHILENSMIIQKDINRAIDKYRKGGYKHLIISPLGIGMAKLPEKAPKTYEFLLSELNRLEQEVWKIDDINNPMDIY